MSKEKRLSHPMIGGIVGVSALGLVLAAQFGFSQATQSGMAELKEDLEGMPNVAVDQFDHEQGFRSGTLAYSLTYSPGPDEPLYPILVELTGDPQPEVPVSGKADVTAGPFTGSGLGVMALSESWSEFGEGLEPDAAGALAEAEITMSFGRNLSAQAEIKDHDGRFSDEGGTVDYTAEGVRLDATSNESLEQVDLLASITLLDVKNSEGEGEQIKLQGVETRFDGEWAEDLSLWIGSATLGVDSGFFNLTGEINPEGTDRYDLEGLLFSANVERGEEDDADLLDMETRIDLGRFEDNTALDLGLTGSLRLSAERLHRPGMIELGEAIAEHQERQPFRSNEEGILEAIGKTVSGAPRVELALDDFGIRGDQQTGNAAIAVSHTGDFTLNNVERVLRSIGAEIDVVLPVVVVEDFLEVAMIQEAIDAGLSPEQIDRRRLDAQVDGVIVELQGQPYIDLQDGNLVIDSDIEDGILSSGGRAVLDLTMFAPLLQ